MRVEIKETITNTYDESRKLIRTTKRETYVLYATEGKKIKNLKTLKVFDGFVCLGSTEKLSDFIEI